MVLPDLTGICLDLHFPCSYVFVDELVCLVVDAKLEVVESHLCCAVMIFHVANAWQESKDVIKLFACCFEDVSHARLLPL